MMRRSNFGDFEDLFERLSHQFDEMGRQFESRGLSTDDIALDVTEEAGQFVVTADLPGFERDDIDLTIADRTLTVSATRETDTEREEGQFIRRERGHASVRRTVRLPEMVSEDDASATYRNGVLTVTLPKLEVDADEDESRHIDIE